MGSRTHKKHLLFIKQFDAAFGGEKFSEISKIRMVRMHLKDAAINWWLKVIKEGKEPTTWAEFKVMFNKKFLPSTFEADVQKEWDAMQQKEAETVENYINRFSATSLKFTALNDVTTLMEMRKFVNGLHPKLGKSGVYVRAYYPGDGSGQSNTS